MTSRAPDHEPLSRLPRGVVVPKDVSPAHHAVEQFTASPLRRLSFFQISGALIQAQRAKWHKPDSVQYTSDRRLGNQPHEIIGRFHGKFVQRSRNQNGPKQTDAAPCTGATPEPHG
jgi:hypothetical protein